MHLFRRTLRILCAAVLIIMLGWLSWQSIDIYVTGAFDKGQPDMPVYSMSDVQHRLASSLPSAMIGLAIIIITIIFHISPEEKIGSSHSNIHTFHLRCLRFRIENLPLSARKETVYRHWVQSLSTTSISICILFALKYLLNVDHFTSWDLEAVMGSMLKHVGPWLLIAFVIAVFAKHLICRSFKKEIGYLQHIDFESKPYSAVNEHKEPVVWRTALFTISIIFIIWGILNGGLYDVLVKAINICTECIGLG